jgi:single-strand DNA-binding protein
MMELNKVMLVGNLTRDPEVRYIPSGSAVADLRLAINRRVFDRNSGERRDETVFIDVTAWEKSAEFCKNYMHKGSGIYIEGRLKMDTWEDKQGGGQRSKITVVAERIQFVESKGTGQTGGTTSSEAPAGEDAGYASAPRPASQAPAPNHVAESQAVAAPPTETKDDLPF